MCSAVAVASRCAKRKSAIVSWNVLCRDFHRFHQHSREYEAAVGRPLGGEASSRMWIGYGATISASGEKYFFGHPPAAVRVSHPEEDFIWRFLAQFGSKYRSLLSNSAVYRGLYLGGQRAHCIVHDDVRPNMYSPVEECPKLIGVVIEHCRNFERR